MTCGECLKSCGKYSMIVGNAMLAVAGPALFGCGCAIVASGTIQEFDHELEHFRANLYTAAGVLMGFGIFTLCVAAFGFYGLCCSDKKSLLVPYIILIIIALAVEIGIGAAAYVKEDEIVESFSDSARSYLKHTYIDSPKGGDQAWDYVMDHFECCGAEGYADFENSTYSMSTNRSVPQACCVQKKRGNAPVNYALCQLEAEQRQPEAYLLENGCKEKIIDFVESQSTMLLVAAIVSVVWQVFIVGAAIITCLCGSKEG